MPIRVFLGRRRYLFDKRSMEESDADQGGRTRAEHGVSRNTTLIVESCGTKNTGWTVGTILGDTKSMSTTCPRCNAPMICRPEGGCWCAEWPYTIPIPDNPTARCLCPQCLLASQDQAKPVINTSDLSQNRK